jgi:hypothetical protein
MTTISAKVIADSVAPNGKRLTTMQLRYPRWIHAEGRTHRLMYVGEDEVDDWEPRTPSLMQDPNLSRNASSSRAVPVAKLIQDVLDDPAVPMFWGKNQRGMQADEECSERVRTWAFGGQDGSSWTNEEAWLFARGNAIEMARAFDEAGYHKQVVNRLLEPFSHINVVVTATEWDNFFELRRHRDAEPHIHALADAMHEAMAASEPLLLYPGQWHTPYVDRAEPPFDYKLCIKMSAARCARVSYLTVEGNKPGMDADLALYKRLVGDVPVHASPAEHQGTPATDDLTGRLCGNFRGWLQWRKFIECGDGDG